MGFPVTLLCIMEPFQFVVGVSKCHQHPGIVRLQGLRHSVVIQTVERHFQDFVGLPQSIPSSEVSHIHFCIRKSRINSLMCQINTVPKSDQIIHQLHQIITNDLWIYVQRWIKNTRRLVLAIVLMKKIKLYLLPFYSTQ